MSLFHCYLYSKSFVTLVTEVSLISREPRRSSSETDVSVVDPDDVSKLVCSGLKPLDAKKLQRWCDAVRARADHMLPSSLNTPASAGLVG